MAYSTFDSLTTRILLVLFSLAMPLLMVPIQQYLLPWPHVVEEVYKAALVAIIRRQERQDNRYHLLTVGVALFFFALSETILYSFNILLIGTYNHFGLRLGLTSTLHLLTGMILYVSWRRQGIIWKILGFFLAVVIHYAYNWLISKYT